MYRKYKAKKTEVNGIMFDSKKEAKRYEELLLLENAGEITDLKLQPKFLLQEKFRKNGKAYREISYIADFQYYDNTAKQIVVEDVKGMKTDVYKIKRKMFEHQYENLTIKEI